MLAGMSTMTSAPPGDLSSGEFARLYKTDPKTVNGWCERGLIPARFITRTAGGHRRISIEAAAPEVRGRGEIYTGAEVGPMFGMSPVTIKNWRKQGVIEGFQTPGGGWRYTEAAINKTALKRLGRPLFSHVNYTPGV